MREIKVKQVEVKKCKEVGINRPGYCLVVELIPRSNKEYIESELGKIEDVVKDLVSGKYTDEAAEVISAVLLKAKIVEPEELLMVEVGEIEGQGLQPLQR